MRRIFLAVPIPDHFRSLLESRLADVSLPGRAVPSANWHVTLRFLGPTPESTLTALVEVLRDSDLGRGFSVTFGGLGAFPRPARASVLWMGIDHGADALARVAAGVEEAARRVGLPPADHPFRAHLTLSRLSPPADVRSFLNHELQIDEAMPVPEVVVFSSSLGRGPAVHEAIERIPLMA